MMNILYKLNNSYVTGIFNNKAHDGITEMKYGVHGTGKQTLRYVKNGEKITLPKPVANIYMAQGMFTEIETAEEHYAAEVDIKNIPIAD